VNKKCFKRSRLKSYTQKCEQLLFEEMLLHRNKVLPRPVFFWGSFKWNGIAFFLFHILVGGSMQKLIHFWGCTSIFKDDTLFIYET